MGGGLYCLLQPSLQVAQQTVPSAQAGPNKEDSPFATNYTTNISEPDTSDGRPRPEVLPDAPSASAASSTHQLSGQERLRLYRHSILSPYTLLGPALGAGIGQWEDEPPEWKQGSAGYFRRFGSGVARHMISETIRFSVAAMDSEDVRYRPSQEQGVWNRTMYAVTETVTSHTASGNRIPAFARFAGIYGAAFFANSWYPDSRATVGGALKRGSTSLASSIGFHLFQEFFPRNKIKFINITP